MSEEYNDVFRCEGVFSVIEVGAIRVSFRAVSGSWEEEAKSIASHAHAASASVRSYVRYTANDEGYRIRAQGRALRDL